MKNANMKAMPPLPTRMQSLPRYKDYPVPFSVMVVDGVPDFRVSDEAKRLRCIVERLCGICGQLMTGHFALIGGPLSTQNRFYYDPAMHVACAEWAMQVCPYLAYHDKDYADTEQIKQHHAGHAGIIEAHNVKPDKPAHMCIVVARDYARARAEDNNVIYLHVLEADVERIETWEFEKGKTGVEVISR